MSSSRRQPKWGEWKYSQEKERYFREGIDSNGQKYLQWEQEADSVPRQTDVSQITQQIGQQTLEDETTYNPGEYSYQSSYTEGAVYPPGTGYASIDDQYSISSQKLSSHKGKSATKPDKHDKHDKHDKYHKGGYGETKPSKSSSSSKTVSASKTHPSSKSHSDKSRSKSHKNEEDQEPFYGKVHQPPIPEDEVVDSYSQDPASYIQYAADAEGQPSDGRGSSYAQPHKSGHHSSRHKRRDEGHDGSQRENSVTQSALTSEADWSSQGYSDSLMQSGAYSSGGDYAQTQDPSFTDAFDDDEARRMAEQQYYTGYARAGSPTEPAYDLPDDDDDDGASTIKSSSKRPMVSGTDGEVEELDPRYMVQPSWKFTPGEVFKILWSEPQGHGHKNHNPRPNLNTITDKEVQRNQYGEKFFIGFRRFIVVASDEGHCTCVPILTYEKKGCKKKGVKPQKHGIVYTLGKSAKALDGEPKLGFVPVRMKIVAMDEKLAKESRVNYSKLVSVEHNVKVFFIGNILAEDFHIISNAVDKCWEDKRRRPKGKK